MNAILCGIHRKETYQFCFMAMAFIHWAEECTIPDRWWLLNFIFTSGLHFYWGDWLGPRPVKSYADVARLIRLEGQCSEHKGAEYNLRGPESRAPAQAQMSFLIQSATLPPGGSASLRQQSRANLEHQYTGQRCPAWSPLEVARRKDSMVCALEFCDSDLLPKSLASNIRLSYLRASFLNSFNTCSPIHFLCTSDSELGVWWLAEKTVSIAAWDNDHIILFSQNNFSLPKANTITIK